MAATLSVIVFGVAALGGLLYLQQPSMIFFPTATLSTTPAQWGLDYEDVEFAASDEVALHGWYIPRENAQQVVLFFHGNAGNISHRGDSVKIFHDLGLSVFIFDYRGYGRSDGRPDEEGLYLDATAAWRYLVETKGYDAGDVIIFGRSLGGAVAAELASRTEPGAVILESCFSSARDVAQSLFPVVSFVTPLRYRFPAAEHLGWATAPVLVLHSQGDEIIPFELGERLYEAAPEPKDFFELTGDHNYGFLHSQPAYQEALAGFLSEHLGEGQ